MDHVWSAGCAVQAEGTREAPDACGRRQVTAVDRHTGGLNDSKLNDLALAGRPETDAGAEVLSRDLQPAPGIPGSSQQPRSQRIAGRMGEASSGGVRDGEQCESVLSSERGAAVPAGGCSSEVDAAVEAGCLADSDKAAGNVTTEGGGRDCEVEFTLGGEDANGGTGDALRPPSDLQWDLPGVDVPLVVAAAALLLLIAASQLRR